ncbi:MAG: hypothetical protein OXC14_21945 [Rhodospirillaceae bacterium]|nr:hypothetical protein [Rhodospirillaceae bacterium]
MPGLGGITGAALTGVFAAEAIGGVPGAIESNAFQVAIQAISVLVTAGYCAIAAFILLVVVWLVTGLRIEGDQESQGLDAALHGESVT